MGHLVSILVPIALFGMIILIVYFSSKFRYQTKKAIIEKGGNIEFPKKKLPYLEFGFAILGVGIGLAISVIPQSLNLSENSKDLLTGGCILIFGALGLVSGYFIRRKLGEDK